MKTIINFLLFSVICLFSITACNEEQELQNEEQEIEISSQLIVTGQLIQNTACKSSKSENITDAESCINYTFDKTNNTLLLQHINAGFNCCPDSLYCTISENNDTILIEEFEVEAGCKCNCLYDLEIEINGIESKSYIIKVIEPYAINQEELCFEVDFVSDENGSQCVNRTTYPWGIEESTALELTGSLIHRTNCKDGKSSELNLTTSNSSSCINYSFNEESNELLITHINTGFNCCPDSLYCNISLNADTITIQEIEEGGICDCNCLYDFDIKLEGVEKKKYILKIIEPYASNQEKINFEIDLGSDIDCTHCVSRTLYPWGIEESTALELTGSLIHHTSCKDGKSSELNLTASNSSSCINYSFNEESNELLITHTNTGFNCCPDSLYCNISLNADTITIQEIEEGGICDCNCLYDFEIKLEGVEKKKYVLKIIEPYASNQEKLNFEIDLASDIDCSNCVTRTRYPWGI